MSRALRRAMARAERRGHKPNRSKARYVTNFQLEHESFDTIERLFQQMRNGELRYDEGDKSWVVMGLDGRDMDVLSALEGWMTFWTELTEEHGIQYDDRALAKLAKSLEYHKPMTIEEVEAAYKVVEAQRTIYRVLPKSVTTAVAHRVQAQIRTENEIKALVGRAA